MKYNIEEIKFFDKTASKLDANICNYDLNNKCSILFYLLSEEDDKLYEGIYNVPSTIIEEWGYDNMILINSLCREKNIVIISEISI